jgi:hypothetical protein
MAQPVSYIVFDIQIIDDFTGKSISDPGGEFFVCVNGAATLATIYDPDNNYAAVANPKALIQGKLRFAIQNAGGGQAYPPLVDIYGITAKGRFFVMRNQAPGDVTIYEIDGNERDFTMLIPWSFATLGANVEYNTGISLPAGTLISPEAAVNVLVADSASHTIKFGTLSTQSGGNSAGFINGVSIATIGVIKATLNSGSPTLGSLLSVASGAGSTQVPEWYPLPALDPLLSITLAASTASGSGFIIQPYTLAV